MISATGLFMSFSKEECSTGRSFSKNTLSSVNIDSTL